MAQIDQYATHLPLLATCLAGTDGPVLELGGGWYSTPLIHALCPRRRVVTLEHDAAMAAWLAERFAGDSHVVRHVPDWDAAEEPDWNGWELAFIDHAPAERRKTELARLRGNADIIVIHDSDVGFYGLEPEMARFAHRVDYTLLWPHTTALSDLPKLKEIFPDAS